MFQQLIQKYKVNKTNQEAEKETGKTNNNNNNNNNNKHASGLYSGKTA